MKVLVTGHRGYIGTVLVPLLLDHDHEVHGLDTDLFRACTFDGEIADIPETIGDVREADIDLVRGYDAIIHLAGLSNDPLGDYNPSLTEDINHQGSLRLAKLAKEAGVGRFLFASSCSNYGGGGQDFLDENARFNPVTPYGVSKVEVERDVAPLASDDFSPTFLRASTAYGMSPRIRFDLVVNNLTAWAFTTGEVHLKSDGTPWRPLVHVEDIGRAYVALLEADRELVHNKAFNVGTTSENYQIREVAEIVHDVVPNCEIGFAEGAEPDKRCYRVDCNLLSRTIHGFKPQWTVRRGVEQLYEAYKRVGITLEDFEGPRFKRIGHVKQLLDGGRLDNTLRWTGK
ncbi:SDR family oxidoreductase [bacterium]|nr:SDR family oxidoreductase [bacterium]